MRSITTFAASALATELMGSIRKRVFVPAAALFVAGLLGPALTDSAMAQEWKLVTGDAQEWKLVWRQLMPGWRRNLAAEIYQSWP
jgi:hypothetical protein